MAQPRKPRRAIKTSKASVAPEGADFVAIDSIRPWVDNPRKNAHTVGKVRASIEKFGWIRPIVANSHPRCKGEIIIGHTARLAALEMGLPTVPVRWVHMTPAKAHAAALADNKLGEISSWDNDLLAELQKAGAITVDDFHVAGFSDDELAKLGTPPELPSTAFAQTTTDRETRYECPKCGHKWRAKSKAVNGKPDKKQAKAA